MRWAKNPLAQIRDILAFRVTGGGRIILAAFVMSALVGQISLSIPIYHLAMALGAVYMVAFFCGLLFWPRLDISGGFPDRAVAGRPIVSEFKITNLRRLPALDASVGVFNVDNSLQIGESPLAPLLRHNESALVRLELLPTRRGIYRLSPPRAFTTFPFNMLRSGSRPRGESTLVVAPFFNPLAGVNLPIGHKHQPGGVVMTSMVGESPEYIGNREYRPGDSTRRIDFRSWARIGKPVVREYQEEYYCRIALILDTFVGGSMLKRKQTHADFEAAISLAASIADAVSRGEFLIDIFAAGEQLHVFRSGRHRANFENVLEILACVTATNRNPFPGIMPALNDELENVSTVVGVFIDWDPTRRDLVRSCVQAGCAARVIIVRDAKPTVEVGEDESWAGPITVLSPKDVLAGGIEQL
jgi:uncharacterized protein (DUF58 family)